MLKKSKLTVTVPLKLNHKTVGHADIDEQGRMKIRIDDFLSASEMAQVAYFVQGLAHSLSVAPLHPSNTRS